MGGGIQAFAKGGCGPTVMESARGWAGGMAGAPEAAADESAGSAGLPGSGALAVKPGYGGTAATAGTLGVAPGDSGTAAALAALGVELGEAGAVTGGATAGETAAAGAGVGATVDFDSFSCSMSSVISRMNLSTSSWFLASGASRR